jgi:hypothetical protein
MNADLKQWEGQLVNEEFRLLQCLDRSDDSAVFLVEQHAGSQSKTTIRFIDANSKDAADRLQCWEAACKLSHPNLLRIFKTGCCQIDGDNFFYALTEFTEENLSQILPQRALTANEARQVLEAVLSALSYIHNEGLIHGGLKPSNIFAVDDTIRISSDTLRPAGQPLSPRTEESVYDAPETGAGTLLPSADVWSLGVLLCEALTQRLPVLEGQQPVLPQGILQPFQEIIWHCLQLDPARRWSVARIAVGLGGEKNEGMVRQVTVPSSAAQETVAISSAPRSIDPAPSPSTVGERRSAKWPYAILLAAAVMVAIVLVARPKPPAAQAPPQTARENAPADSSPHAMTRASRLRQTASVSGVARAGRGQVAERLMPQVSASALHTIHGKVRILLDVDVDETGSVTKASLRSGQSRYFIGHSLEAAKRWEFQPPLVNDQPVASRWLVQFTFTRSAVDDSARQIKP